MRTNKDRKWQDSVISALEQANPAPTADHVEAVRGEAGGVRIRPEDVAAAVTMPTHPADSVSVIARAAEILARLGADAAP